MTPLLSPAFARTLRANVISLNEDSDSSGANAYALPVRVLVLEADRLYANALRAAVNCVMPDAFLRIGDSFSEAGRIIEDGTADLLLTGLTLPDGDVFKLLRGESMSNRDRPRVLAITPRKEQRLLVTLRSMPIEGVFDPSTDGQAELELAVHSIVSGGTYWSASLLERLTEYSMPNAVCRMLTRREQDVLSVIGDGSDNEEAAAVLGIKAATVASIRRDLHRKLNIRHRGELIRLAVQHGFVRFTAGGVARLGWVESWRVTVEVEKVEKVPVQRCPIPMIVSGR